MIKNYEEFKIKILEFEYLLEMAFSDENVQKIERLKQSKDIKGLIKEIKIKIDKLIPILKNISINDFLFRKIENHKNYITYQIKFQNSNSKVLITEIESILDIDDDLSNILNMKVFGDDLYHRFYPEVIIHYDNYNRIDFNEGLPLFLRGIGLGTKIYKQLIFKLGYISSNPNLYDNTIESDFVWETLAKDKNFYIFSMKNILIIFDKKFDINKLENVLNNFYKDCNTNDCILDDDFLIDYPDIYNKIKNILN